MSILTTSNVSQSFADFDVFRGVTVSIPNDGKIGLVGPNGIGKTTLLLILAGLTQPATGSVHTARGKRIGYLRQEAVEAFAEQTNTVFEEMLTVFSDLRAQEARLQEMEAAMSAGTLTDRLFDKYSAAQERFELAGGYEYELRIKQVLDGLGFKRLHWSMPLCHLSGGQKTRALLARLLLDRPDLLILDEPTNHLDVDAVEWLENALRAWPGALLIVSHDRYFLDNVVNTIWEMNRAGIETYRGNYSAYLQQRQERWERQQQIFDEEKERLLKDFEFVERNIVRASTNARAVGLLKRLSRDLAIVEAFGIAGLRSSQSWLEMGLGAVTPLGVAEAGQRVRALQSPLRRPLRLNMNLHVAHRSGDIVLRTKHLHVGYPNAPLFNADNIELRRRECAALIGPNGAGKTTFLRTILGQLEPLSGETRLGASLKIGYFVQAHDELDSNNTVIDELTKHRQMLAGEARSYLARYLFRQEDVFKPVSALSGGERGRLALAILALNGANFLLLDEPTNHLDIPAQEVLQEVLEQFAGTILLVTHDRYLVDRLATQIWDLRAGRLRVFKGTYREFLAQDAHAISTSRSATKKRAEIERAAAYR
jgi:ATP-binding cassette subfamily F protein 3